MLSPHELSAQSHILDDCRRQFERVVCGKTKLSRHTILFSTIVKLRQLCSYGAPGPARGSPTHQSSIGWRREVKSPSAYGYECEVCRGGDEDFTSLLEGSDVCPECSRDLCSVPFSTADSRPLSPLTSIGGTQGGEIVFPGSSISPNGDSECSSKLKAVIDNLEQHQATSKRYISLVILDPPQALCTQTMLICFKSIVFSSWRPTLDSLADMLRRRGICYHQIDGRVSHLDRQSRLADFQNEPHVRVMLISIETGSVG